MFDTFVLYLIVYVSFHFFQFKDYKWNVLVTSLFTVALIVGLFMSKKSTWWNTVFCFPLGMWYGYYKDRIEVILKKRGVYWVVSAAMILVFGIFWAYRYRCAGTVYIILSALFALVVVLVTMKVKVGNPILRFLGKHLFSIYILQRIPFMILQRFFENIYLYFIFSFLFTLMISILYDKAYAKLKTSVIISTSHSN